MSSDGPKPPPPHVSGAPAHCDDPCVLSHLGFGEAARAALADPRATGAARAEVERAIAERALHDRLASVTALAAGVAHELNNPLAYVMANLSFLADRMTRVVELLSGAPRSPNDTELVTQLADAMREARTGAERMRTVVRDLRTLAKVENEARRPVDVRAVIDSCLNIAWSDLRKRAQVSRDLEPVPPVLGDEARLAQLFLNLILNASQAIPGGHPDEHVVRIATRSGADGRVVVEVQDSGAGIAPEHLRRIFDPFFTTKGPGSGTGLGLSICHAVASAMGGEIQVESMVGTGSTFRVLLPAAPQVAAAEVGLPPPPPRSPARARILVVDDEPLVGAVLARTLTDHDVTVVQSAQAALTRVCAGESWDVVLSDLLMPEMSGMDLYRAVAKRQPALARRFVFLTGGAFTPAARDFLDQERVEYVEKPFDLHLLRSAVARQLEAART